MIAFIDDKSQLNLVKSMRTHNYQAITITYLHA